MTDSAKLGRGKYVATPVTVTFPSEFPNAKLAGKTVTYAGRGRRPTWWALAVDAGLIAADEVEAETATDTTEAPAATTEAQA